MDSELRRRLDKLREAGAFEKVDRIALINLETDRIDPNFTYLADAEIEYSLLLVRPDSVELHVPEMMEERAGESWAEAEMSEDVREVLGTMDGLIGINGSYLPHNLTKKLEGVPIDVSSYLEEARSRKTDEEVRRIGEAAERTREIVEEVERKGRTEEEVEADLISSALSEGLEPAFMPVVAAGEGTSSPHHTSAGREIRDFHYVDFGVRHENYSCDLTMAWADGERFRKHIRRLEMVLGNLEDIMEEGVRVSTLKRRTKEILGEYGDNVQHALGHGVGIEVHEAPSLKDEETLLEEGMVVALEPAYYLKTFGVRLERNYLIEKNGCRRL